MFANANECPLFLLTGFDLSRQYPYSLFPILPLFNLSRLSAFPHFVITKIVTAILNFLSEHPNRRTS